MAHGINARFSRAYLSDVLADVRLHHPTVARGEAWVYRTDRNSWEFHGPDKYYWYGSADNAYDARAKGWAVWLQAVKTPGYEEED